MTEERIRFQVEIAVAVARDKTIDSIHQIIPAEFRQFVSDLPEVWTADYQDITGCLLCQYHKYLEHPVRSVGGTSWTEPGLEKWHPLTFWELAMAHSNIDGFFTKSSVLLAIKIYDELYPPINGIPNDITPVSPSEVPTNAEIAAL